MGLFDFIFGNKKREEQERLEKERLAEQKRLQEAEKVRIAKEREQRLAENRLRETERQARLKMEAERKKKKENETMSPFVFSSNQHQRYENNTPVQGLQECLRTISVIKNTNGCSGYKLTPGDGYIVKIFNDDLGKPNMSDKPMRVVSKTANKVELRGFPIEAQTPFGWQEVDYRDYGLVVYYHNEQVEKCVLHMYDRNIRIEYLKRSSINSKKNTTESTSCFSAKHELPETELLVQKALLQLSLGNDGDAVYHPLYKAWRSFQQNPSQLKKIVDCGKYGMGLMIFLSYGTISDIDIIQQITSVAYLFLSKAIQKSPKNINLYKNRLILMFSNHEAFEYTVSSVVNKDTDICFMNMMPLKARDALFKMEFADLQRSPQLMDIDIFKQQYIDLKTKIANGFFGPNQNDSIIEDSGNSLHKDIFNYLENKVLNNEDIEF